jgi:RHS repeat-associated protein
MCASRVTPLVVAVLATLLAAARSPADTGTALGDRTGEGSTPFTGLAQAPEANLFTGALSTAIPIDVPPGRRGMTPQLALRYSSAAGPSPFGVGWDVPIGRIERSTTWGVPRCGGAHSDDFVLILPTGASDLVREAPSSNFYRPAVEQAYVRAEKFAAQNYWIVHDRSGIKYTFGDTDSARVGNSTPPTFLSQAADGTCQLTTTWALTRIEDPNGNVIDVTWAKILNVLYPITVRYGGNTRSGAPPHLYTIRFLPEWRPPADRIVSARDGVVSRLVWRMYAVTVETDVPSAGTEVRTYALAYRDTGADGAPEGVQSLLSAVGVTGRPTQHLAYTPSITGQRSVLSTIAKPPGAWNELRVVTSSREVSQTLLDMNGDGVLDLVRSDDAPVTSWAVWWGSVASDGTFGWQSAATPWQAPGSWTHLRNVIESGCGNGWSCTQTDTFDITGDGIPDHIDASNATDWVVYKGRGVPQWGFAPGVSWPAPNRQYIRRSFQGKTHQDVIDVNGDGLPDLVHSAGVQAEPYQWDVYLNTGSGFESARLPVYPAPFTELVVGLQSTLVQVLTDFNGDGLPDIVRAGAEWDPRCQPSPQHIVSCLAVYVNTGQGFALDPALIPVPAGDRVQDVYQFGGDDDTAVVRDLVDINGDGLPDWVSRPQGDDRWYVLLNLGGTLEALTYVPSPYWGPPYVEGIATRIWTGGQDFLRTTFNGNSRGDLVDVNGDGFLDLLSVGASSWTARLHDARERPNLLGLMENGLGGTNTIGYRPSTAYDNRGGDAQPDLPFISWVVDKTRQNDGQCTPPAGADVFTPGPPPARNPCIDSGNELVATYHYQDGRFDPLAREFRGFRRVVRSGVEGSAEPANQTVTYFAQDATASGRILQVDNYAGSTNLVRSEANQWGTRSVGGNRTQIWLSATHRVRWDLIGAGAPDMVSTLSDPPDAYGNITHHYSASFFGGPRVDTYTTYAVPQAGSQVFDRPSNVRVTEPSGVLEEKWFYYDGSGADGLPLGAVGAGNLKRTRARLTASHPNGPETRMAYDAYGNVTSATDANGRTTVTVYDSRALYPRIAVNALWHLSVTEVDYRWAQPTSAHDPNGVATRYAYDSAGRRTCLARPGDSLSSCSVSYAYHFATEPGELSWVETAVRQDGPHPPLTTRHYFDALGRPRYTDTFRVVDGTPTTVRSNHVVYDPGGRVRTLHHPHLASAAAPNNGATTYDYHLNGSAYLDPLGRVYRTINADQTVRRTEYAAALTTTYDEDGQRTDTITDTFGRPVKQTAYNGATPYVSTDRTYDALGRLLTLRQGGTLLRTITYDSLGRKTQLVDQDSGTWRYAYDGVGNLRWQDDPRPGRHVEFCYDAINRPTRRCSYANDSQTLASCGSAAACSDPEAVFYRYDEQTIAHSRGRLTGVDDASGSTRIDEYDTRGRQRRLTKSIDLADGSRQARFAFTYDGNDRVVATTYPDGEIVFTEYDDAGQPIALRNQSNEFYVTDALYDIFGRPTRVDHVNGVSDTRAYGGASTQHRLATLTAARGATTHLDLFYFRYTARGLLEALIDSRNLNGALSNTAVFTYDALGRLINQDSSHNPLDAAFAYDPMGNLTRCGDRYLRYDNPNKPHQPTTLHVGGPAAPGQLIAHDANGNRTFKASQSYAYDGSDRLAHVVAATGEVEFTYDHSGQQAAKTVTTASTTQTTRFYSPLAETTAGTLTKWYFLGPLRVASRSTNSVGWETAALAAPSVWLAAGSIAQPALTVVVASRAGGAASAALLCISLGLLVAPWRRRPVVGVAVRPSHAILVALAVSVTTLPWPIAFHPNTAWAAAPAVRHYHVDHLGSTQVITDANGDIVEQIRYRPYGGIRGHWDRNNVLIAAPGDGNRREFAGYLSEPLSGLQYAGARFYDPEIGAFLTHDPATQFASPYSYGGGDPVNWSDPTGETFIVEFFVALAVSVAVSAALNTIIAAAQGLPPGAIGKAALGGAIAGAVGVGLGVVASAAALGAASAAGTLATNVTFAGALEKLGEVAWRSAWSTSFANAAGQTAAAAGAPGDAVTAISMVAGFASSVAYDRIFPIERSVPLPNEGAQTVNVSNTPTHTNITVNSTARSSSALIRNGAEDILKANLARDEGVWNVLNNESHFDFGAQDTFSSFKGEAFDWLAAENYPKFYEAVGGALHHLQDQYALGHIVPGTSFFKGPLGAPMRFLIHNAVGGEITFTQASERASLQFLESLSRPPL